jgi:hypothetical protein
MDAMTPEQEKSLRFRLSILCMAAVAGREGDMAECTKSVLDYVRAEKAELMAALRRIEDIAVDYTRRENALIHTIARAALAKAEKS